jgi:transposase
VVKDLVAGKTVGVDSTMLEANAAMKSIIRRDSGEDWKAYVTRLMREEGVIEPTHEPNDEEVRRYDRKRKDKKVSNEEWASGTDCDSRIAHMKDGRTHLAYKAEHVVDLKSDLVLAAEITLADQGDTQTMTDSVLQAQLNLQEAGSTQAIEEVAADKGYHGAGTVELCDALEMRTYIPEPQRQHEARWTDKAPEMQRAVYNNRRRVGRDKSKQFQRRRSEVCERTFAHICDSGGMRRSWLRKKVNVAKRYLIAAAAHNLGRILRKLFGVGKPRVLQGEGGLAALTQFAIVVLLACGKRFEKLPRSIQSNSCAFPAAA